MKTLFTVLAYPSSGWNQEKVVIFGILLAVVFSAYAVLYIAWRYLKSKFTKEKGGK